LRSVDSLPALHFVLARSVNLTRLERLKPLLALFLVRLVDSVGTCLACLNPPAMPLLMRWVDSSQPLVLAREVNWKRLECLNPLPAALLVDLLEWAQPLVLPRSLNGIRSECLNYHERSLLGSAQLRPLALAHSVDWTSLNVPSVPLLMRSLGSARVRRLVLARLVCWTSLNVPGLPLVRLLHSA
jgi:hypothetical protein